MKRISSLFLCLLLAGVSLATGFLSSGVSVPSDFPDLTVCTSGSPDPGNYFLASLAASDATSSSYVIITDNNAEPIFYWHWNKGIFCVKVQPGGLLSFSTRLPGNVISWLVMDSTYAFQDTFALSDNTTDNHDFTMLENGHSLLIGSDQRTIDMSQVIPGGNPNALVKGLSIEEQDENHVPVFEWSSFDHFEITDAAFFVDLTAPVIDYVHCNSISADADGNILLSCLAMNQCVKIDRGTGEVIWRLGGLDADSSSFTMIGDPLGGFSSHHDFQSSGDGLYTIFDNGRFHNPQLSRALEYELDTDNMTATLVWSYQISGLYGTHLGSVQRLPDGNYVIGWGDVEGTTTLPDITEVLPDGTGEHSIRFVDPVMESYRGYKYAWEGQALVPYLVAEKDSINSAVILTYNVFGDNEYEQYRIWQGVSSSGLTPITLTPDRQATIWELPIGWNYFAVSALDSNLVETGISNIDSVFVDWTGISSDTRPSSPSSFLYPNPASSFVVVPEFDDQNQNFRADFFDTSGRLVLTSDEPGVISITPLSTGLYTVRISGESEVFVENLVVLR